MLLRRLLALMVLLPAVLLLAGCTAAPALRPVDVRSKVIAHPDIAPWWVEHSSPAVLKGMSAVDVKRYLRYKPSVTVDLVREGMRVTLSARFGPEPRRLEVLVDRNTGQFLSMVRK
jgi:hypothetical protein